MRPPCPHGHLPAVGKISPPTFCVNLLDKRQDLRYIPSMSDDNRMPTEEEVRAAARVLSMRGASKGGRTRAKNLSKKRRKDIARMGGEASARKRKREKG